jgi:hypothetical protein
MWLIKVLAISYPYLNARSTSLVYIAALIRNELIDYTMIQAICLRLKGASVYC